METTNDGVDTKLKTNVKRRNVLYESICEKVLVDDEMKEIEVDIVTK